MTPEPTLSSIAEAIAKEIYKLADKEANNGMLPHKGDMAKIILRHLQPLAKDRDDARRELADLYFGKTAVLPSSEKHAKAIILVAEACLRNFSTPKPASSS